MIIPLLFTYILLVCAIFIQSVMPLTQLAACPLVKLSLNSTMSINKLQTTTMTDEERALPAFTRNRLKKLSNWSEWDGAYEARFDDHFDSDTIGKAVLCPTPVADCLPNVIRAH